jgi:tetratricopeptide (TPR) repeat protein
MGKLIICNGKQSETPFYLKITNTKVYSIEELCYYIYHNVDILNEDFFGESFIRWLKEDLNLEDRACKLSEIKNKGGTLKEIVVSILCSCDYYTESEIKEYIHRLDELVKLSPYEKLKKKADNYLKYRQFAEAALAYEKILDGEEVKSLSSEEYGNILHNLAIIKLHMVGIAEAAGGFKEAYERNKNPESLKQYLMALKLSKQERIFMEEANAYGVADASIDGMSDEIRISLEEAKQTQEYKIMETFQECRQNGRINQLYRIADELINRWKQEFRRENS